MDKFLYCTNRGISKPDRINCRFSFEIGSLDLNPRNRLTQIMKKLKGLVIRMVASNCFIKSKGSKPACVRIILLL